MANTRDEIREYLIRKTRQLKDISHEHFTTTVMADELHISRSAASQYLNEMVLDGTVLKIKSRPVYFLDMKTLKDSWHTEIEDTDFLDIEDLLGYLMEHGSADISFKELVGYDGSLKKGIAQAAEMLEYPPYGMPVLLYGNIGTGKKTIAEMLCRNSMNHKGMITRESVIRRVEIKDDNSEAVTLIRAYLKDKTPQVIILSNLEKAGSELENLLGQKMEAAETVHWICLSSKAPKQFLSANLMKQIPLAVHLHDYRERPKEEREAIVIELFRREQEKLNKKIRISSNVLRTLANEDYPQNIADLSRIIRLILARTSLNADGDMITVHTYDLPQDQLENVQVNDSDVSYITCDQYVPGRQIDLYLDYFTALLNSCGVNDPIRIRERFNSIFSDMSSYLYMSGENDAVLKGIEIAMANIVSSVAVKRLLNFHGNFCFVLARLTYMFTQHANTLSFWEEAHEDQLAEAEENIQRIFVNASIITDEINDLIRKTLEIHLPRIIRIIITMMLQSQNSDLSTNGLFGVIICHGYSTAASIAGAVNSLIGSYVFDSIDMPMETTVEEIRKTLEDKIRRINRFADVVILVDMGSLEQIAEAVQDRSVAIINNVSTKMALNIGYRIRGGTGIDEIFRDAESDYRIEYRVIRNKKKDSILFISESGLETAQRMADLFEDSLPRPIPAQLRAIPYERIQNGELQIAESENILFAACTEEVILPGFTCIPLEGLITNSNLDTVKEKLNPYLSIQELNQLILNIRTNFTLVNVVQYLTILNPKTLLDYITAAVDALQRKRSVELEGGRLVGLYIHLSCLIERLVTKSGVLKNDAATEQFVKEHRDFIEDIRMSFRQITRHYHIEIPDSEMKYIYSFMHEQ